MPAPPAALPQLDSTLLDRRITVRLRDVPLRLVLDAIAGATGLKFVPDHDVRTDQRCTLFLNEARLTEVLDLLAMSNQLAMRAMDDHTVLIYPNTPAKQRAYAELQTRTFVLRHADAATIATLLKTMLKSQLLVTDVHSNTLVLRDTPDVLRVAEQIIAANDLPGGDVMIEVQVIEVSRQRLSQLGVGWPGSLSLSTPADVATVGALRALSGNAWLFTPLALSLNLQLQDIDANVIANPSVRAHHKEKARVMIGDKVPVITNQLTQGGTSAAAPSAQVDPTGQANANPSLGGAGQATFTGSVQYIDVGLKLEVEPHLYGDGDIGIALNLELSQISKTLSSASGVVYQVGTRQAQTSMRLHEGQTQWLGGLINNQERAATSGLPGLASFPVLGRLFGVDRQDRSETELLLAITPRRVRDQGGLPAGTALIDSGDEGRVRANALEMRAPAGDNGATPTAPLPGIEITGQILLSAPTVGPRGTIAPMGLPEGVTPMPSEMPGVPIVVPRRVPNAVPRQTEAAPADPAPPR
jgi:general secretion pathway protein D